MKDRVELLKRIDWLFGDSPYGYDPMGGHWRDEVRVLLRDIVESCAPPRAGEGKER